MIQNNSASQWPCDLAIPSVMPGDRCWIRCKKVVGDCRDICRKGKCPRAKEEKTPNSTELLLVAHDEWKRREERKHLHPEIPWITGWISGFLTSREFVKRKAVEIREKMEGKK